MSQPYMPAFLEGKKEGMSVLAEALAGELNAYIAAHPGEAATGEAPGPELYERIAKMISAAHKGDSHKVYILQNTYGHLLGIYASKALAEYIKEKCCDSVVTVEEWEVRYEVGN